MQSSVPPVVARLGRKAFRYLSIGVRAVIAAPEGDLVADRRNGRDPSDGPERRRPHLNIYPSR